MSNTSLILLVVFQLVALAIFFWLVWPSIRSERWKEKFWNKPDARALVLAFALIALAIVLFRLVMDKLLPVETLP